MNCCKIDKEYIQGSTYILGWKLLQRIENKPHVIIDDDVEIVEFNIGPIRKLFPQDVTFDPVTQKFMVSLSQEDTFQLPAGTITRFARIKWKTGQVKCTQPMTDKVHKTGAMNVL